MQKTIKSIRAILLAVVLAVGVFAVIPAPVYAAQPQLTNRGVTNITETWAYVNYEISLSGAAAADLYVAVYIAPGPFSPSSPTGADIKGATIGDANGCVYINSEWTDIDATDFNFSPSSLIPATNYIAYVVAEDANVSGDFSNILTFTFKTWPTITSAASFSCVAGIGGSFDLTALGTGTINWTLSGAPAGVSLGSPLLIVAPSVPAGVYPFTITATSTLGSTSQNFTLTVTAAGGGTTGGGGGAAATTGVSPKTDDATGGNMFLLVMMLLLAAGAVYTGRKAAKANK